MAAPLALGDYKEALIFLGAAGVVVPLFRRLKISPVIGFLCLGMVLGPHGLGRLAESNIWAAAFSLSNSERMQQFAELGVVFLLFAIGLELSFERLQTMRRLIFGLGALQVGVSAVVIASGAMLLGMDPRAAAIIGGALALSSTAIVMPVLAERKRLNTGAGRAIFAILLFQDLMVAPLLFMVSMLDIKASAGLSTGVGLLYAILPAMAVMVIIIGLGRLVLRPLFHQVALTGSTEFFVAVCLLVIIGAGIAFAAAGLSMALGAFVAGLLLAETEYRREVESTIEPFKGLLLGLFFISVGASLDVAQVIDHPTTTIGLAAALIATKYVIIFVLCRALRFSPAASQEIALPLGPGGEFAFVMITAAVATQALDPATASRILIAVTLSMVAIPILAWLSSQVMRLSPEPPPDYSHLTPTGVDQAGHVIVIGYGRVGLLVSEMLTRHDIAHIATDSNPNLVTRERRLGKHIFWGDATRVDFLRACGLEQARAVVITMNSPRAIEIIVALVHRERPDITIVARARDAHHATVLYGLGASDAIPETIEASLQLSEAVLVDIGIPMGHVIASIHEKRDEYRKILQPVEGARAPRGIKMSARVKKLKKPATSEKHSQTE